MTTSRKERLVAGLLCAHLALISAPALALAETMVEMPGAEAQTEGAQLDSSIAQPNAEALDAQSSDTLVQTESSASQTQALMQTQTQALAPTTYTNMYRLYNPNSGQHFYTGDWDEVTHVALAGWRLEGVGWVAPSVGDPVFRLYNPNGGDHHYTFSEGERDLLVEAGWHSEGIGWYSDSSAGGVSVYRQYNPNALVGSHNFTLSQEENDALVKEGWRAEGVAWKASSMGAAEVEEGWIGDETGNRIYIEKSGAARTGLFSVDGKQYFGDSSGRIVRNESVEVDGDRYDADSDGVLTYNPVPIGCDRIFEQLPGLSSQTDYAIIVDTVTNRTCVFQGGAGNWSLLKNYVCSTGKPSTPTVLGTFTLTDRDYCFGDGYTCYYWTRFYGPYLFHSIEYEEGTFEILDGRLGQNVSMGCVRLPIDDAKWIYDNMPYGTTVITL